MLDDWLAVRRRASAQALAAHVSATDLVRVRPAFGSRIRPVRGSVLASRRVADWDPEPDYLFHWVRDAAIVMLAARHLPDPGWDARMADHATFSLGLLTEPVPEANPQRPVTRETHLRYLRDDVDFAQMDADRRHADPRANPDGTPDFQRWARPQHDGPALRALSVLAWPRPLPDAARQLTARDLDFVRRSVARPAIGPWEEDGELGFHAFTMIAQHAALTVGGDGGQDALTTLERAIDALWSTDLGAMRAWSGGAAPDSAVCLAALLHPEPFHYGIAAPRILATRRWLEAWAARRWTVNRGQGDLVGRSPGDGYFGGNPWVPVTLGLAEQDYRLALIAVDSDLPEAAETVRDLLPESTEGGPVLARALMQRADRRIEALARLLPADGPLPEQVDGTTGRPVSCLDLAWSHAALIEVDAARRAALRRLKG